MIAVLSFGYCSFLSTTVWHQLQMHRTKNERKISHECSTYHSSIACSPIEKNSFSHLDAWWVMTFFYTVVKYLRETTVAKSKNHSWCSFISLLIPSTFSVCFHLQRFSFWLVIDGGVLLTRFAFVLCLLVRLSQDRFMYGMARWTEQWSTANFFFTLLSTWLCLKEKWINISTHRSNSFSWMSGTSSASNADKELDRMS